MRIQYGIAGFMIGVMTGLLIGIIEMKILRYFQLDTITPFLIGFTVLACILTGVILGARYGKRQ